MIELLVEITKLITASPWAIFIAVMAVIFYVNYKTLTSYKERPESFEMVVACLKEDKFGVVYRRLLGIVLDKISDWIGDKPALKPRYSLHSEQGATLNPFNRFFSSNPFTAPSYELLLRLAFVYPIFAFLVVWALGGDGSVAGMHWLNKNIADIPTDTRWKIIIFAFILPVLVILWLKHKSLKVQALFLGLTSAIALIAGFSGIVTDFWILYLLLFILLYISGWGIAWEWQRGLYKAHQLIYPFAFAVAGVVAGTVAVAVAVSDSVVTDTIVGAGAIAGAFAVAGASAGTFAVAGASLLKGAGGSASAVVFGGAGALFLIQSKLQLLSKRKEKEGIFWLLYSLVIIVLTVTVISSSSNTNNSIFLLFYLLFPLLNAPIDWLSLGITRGLLNSIRHEHHGGWTAFAWALLDVVLAIFFLLLVSAVLVIAMGLVDSTLLQTTLNEINQEATAKNYYWVYAMLFTTLIPTLLHFALAASALTLWLPQTWRHKIANNVQHNHYKLLATSAYLTITPAIGLLAPIALLYGLYTVLTLHGSWFGEMLLHWVKFLADSLQLLPVSL